MHLASSPDSKLEAIQATCICATPYRCLEAEPLQVGRASGSSGARAVEEPAEGRPSFCASEGMDRGAKPLSIIRLGFKARLAMNNGVEDLVSAA